MSMTTTPRRRWTDAAIESELRTWFAELGHFPTRQELVARGQRALWDAMRSAGGLDAWRERISTNGSAASPQDIAVRAYELYELGFPGDDVAHWLAAEAQLAAAR
jgi:hypothetical protein